jgi:hypothetical protein
VSASESGKRDIMLGPFFSVGVVLLVWGLIRRRPVLAAAGLGSIWFDQRSELGRSLKEKVRAKYMSGPDLAVEDNRDRPVVRDLHSHPSAEDAGRDADT